MEQRIQQFHDDTKTIPKPPTAKTVKQMNTLKKFIFKNQDYRFSDKEKNKLFACIEAYFTVFDRRYYALLALLFRKAKIEILSVA